MNIRPNFANTLFALVIGSSLVLTACNSPEEDAEARGETETPTTVQDAVEVEAMNENAEASSEETQMQDAHDVETIDADNVDAEAVESIDNQQLGTHDNYDVADGTDQEEHVSTY